MIDLYKILQVSADADQATIRKAYRKLAKIYHPARQLESSEAEIERTKALFREI